MTNTLGNGKTALILGGGAPNSTLIAGALAAFVDYELEFDVISASGAGVLMGLLYTAPKDGNPREALERWADVGVSDNLYKLFPVNYKVFQKPGNQAEGFRSALSPLMAGHNTSPLEHPMLGMLTQPMQAMAGAWSDWAQLMFSAMSPSNLSSKSLGLCAHLPFLEQSVNFDAVSRMGPEFYINAFNIEQGQMTIWNKQEITPLHVRAALSFPFLYAPTEIDGEHYIEGAALDTLNFEPFTTDAKGQQRHPEVDTLVVLDILGDHRFIRKPRNLYDAWVRSIITPLVKISKAEQRLFELEHNRDPLTGNSKRQILRVDLLDRIPKKHWPSVLDWSTSNMQTLFQVGYQAGLDFCREHGSSLGAINAPPSLAA
ncbi:patatin-like phospholipase family protein [Curvibacter sp. CHRR-16]|uniref:patatin-like phospholipase family protein n=1 Tax=Curvibacter sp. CHRR-16 TaxID=2835872 RepID=UPI001BD9A81A|nr:patatin-like phospholipase family protein [Curvibacter sp. CHRR-16]MBT0571646.1 patatin-like phospholipase family protein [Curvibacter sp. CHRR-16]